MKAGGGEGGKREGGESGRGEREGEGGGKETGGKERGGEERGRGEGKRRGKERGGGKKEGWGRRREGGGRREGEEGREVLSRTMAQAPNSKSMEKGVVAGEQLLVGAQLTGEVPARPLHQSEEQYRTDDSKAEIRNTQMIELSCTSCYVISCTVGQQ